MFLAARHGAKYLDESDSFGVWELSKLQTATTSSWLQAFEEIYELLGKLSPMPGPQRCVGTWGSRDIYLKHSRAGSHAVGRHLFSTPERNGSLRLPTLQP